MKSIFIILLGILCLFVLYGCKKKSNPSSLQVQVENLTAKTAITIKITNQNNATILNVVNQFGNTTYTASPVNVGDMLTININTNVPDDLQGDGDGIVLFKYGGDEVGSIGGILQDRSTTLTINSDY